MADQDPHDTEMDRIEAQARCFQESIWPVFILGIEHPEDVVARLVALLLRYGHGCIVQDGEENEILQRGRFEALAVRLQEEVGGETGGVVVLACAHLLDLVVQSCIAERIP